MAYISASRVLAVSLSTLAAWVTLAGVDIKAQPDTRTSREAGQMQGAMGVVAAAVNRDAKSDRGALMPSSGATTTLSFQLVGQPDVSIVMRLSADESNERAMARNGASRSSGRMMIACEPMVSPLATAAKGLAPGRCVT